MGLYLLKEPFKKDEKTNTVKISPKLEEGSREAILEYQVLESRNKYSLILGTIPVEIETIYKLSQLMLAQFI